MRHDRHGKGVSMYLGNVSQSDAIVRSMTAAQWTAGNYLLRKGELGIESDTGKQKAGEGKPWSSTSYFTPGGVTTQINIADDGGTLHVLTFTNGILTAYDLV